MNHPMDDITSPLPSLRQPISKQLESPQAVINKRQPKDALKPKAVDPLDSEQRAQLEKEKKLMERILYLNTSDEGVGLKKNSSNQQAVELSRHQNPEASGSFSLKKPLPQAPKQEDVLMELRGTAAIGSIIEDLRPRRIQAEINRNKKARKEMQDSLDLDL